MNHWRIGFFVICSALTTFGQAKNLEPVKVHLGLIVPMQLGDPLLLGSGIVLQPMIAINQQFAAGLRTEIGFLFAEDDQGVQLGHLRSYQAKGEYQFSPRPNTPVAGFGLGFFHLDSLMINDQEASLSTGLFPSLSPSLGMNLGSWHMAANMNVIFNNERLQGTSLVSAIHPILSLELSYSASLSRLVF